MTSKRLINANTALQRKERLARSGSSIRQAVKAAKRGEIVLELLRLDCGTQSRAITNPETEDAYAEAMREGATFPPIVVFYDGVQYMLVDGFHRVSAARQIGLKSLPVDLRQGTLRDAVLYSVGVNATHGLPRTTADKRRAIERLLRDDEWSAWSDREIARRVGVTNKTVASVRKGLSEEIPQMSNQTRTVERGGTQYQQTVKSGSENRTNDLPEPSTARQPLPSDMPEELIAAVEEGVVASMDAIKLANTLQRLPGAVRSLVLTKRIFHAEKVSALSSLYTSSQRPESNHTFEEIALSGGFHYGEDMDLWCDFIKSDLRSIYAALRSLSDQHRMIAGQASHAEAVKLTPHAKSPAVAALTSSDSVEWYTPARYIQAVHAVMGVIDIDPASCEEANRTVQAVTFHTASSDGMAHPWTGTVFLNPPYGRDDGEALSNQARWSRRLLAQYAEGVTTEAILLVNAATEAKWFQPLWSYPLCFTDHRITFTRPGGHPGVQPTSGSAFVYLGGNVVNFANAFRQFGAIVLTTVTGEAE